VRRLSDSGLSERQTTATMELPETKFGRVGGAQVAGEGPEDLLIGSGIEFTERGKYDLKRVPGNLGPLCPGGFADEAIRAETEGGRGIPPFAWTVGHFGTSGARRVAHEAGHTGSASPPMGSDRGARS